MYNAESFIEQCLASVLVQTFKDFEVIVVDDDSTDKSLTLVKRFLPEFNGKLKIIQMKQHSGSPGEPRNVGIDNSTGEYIYFLDSDDMLTPTALEEWYSFTSDKDIDIIHSEKSYVPMVKSDDGGLDATDIIDESTLFNVFDSMNCDEVKFEVDDIANRILRFSQKQFWTTVWRNLFSRELIVDNHLRFIDTKILEDDVFIFQCLYHAKKILRIPNNFYIYRMRKDSISHSTTTYELANRIGITLKIFNVLDDFMSNEAIFTAEVKYCVFDFFVEKLMLKNIAPYKIDDLLRERLSIVPNDNIALAAYSFSMMNHFRQAYSKAQRQIEVLTSK